MKKILSVNLLLVMIMLAGCAKPYGGETDNAAVDNNYGDLYNGSENNVYGNPQYNNQASVGDFYEDPSYGVNVVGGPNSTAKDRVIYFAFDSAELDSRSVAVVQEHAKYLRQNPKIRVVLEGHTDERGTREYNIALGERRAYSVKKYFEQNGVNANQIRVLSYGEEKPAASCSSELCYAKNRRAVIVY